MPRGGDYREVTSVAESRGIQYSAEAVGEPGNLRCHVFRLWLAEERRAQYSIFVCNETSTDAQAVAFIPEAPGAAQRTILQTLIGRRSEFSTGVFLEGTPAGSMPELRVTLISSTNTYFTLVVPGVALEDTPGNRSSGTHWLALPAESAAPQNLPAVRSASPPSSRPFVASGPDRASTAGAEASQPAPQRASPMVTPTLLVFTALLGGIAFFFGRPQVTSLIVPEGATAGATVSVSYRATGLGTADYAVLGPDGQTIARGPLNLGIGSFALTVPRAPAAQAYLVRIAVTTPLASAGAEEYLHVPAPPSPPPAPVPPKRRVAPPPAPPQIRSLALDRAALASGDPLTVYYDVSATSGSIELFDPVAGIVYEKSEIAASGHTTFVAPHVDGERFLSVVATAQRGHATTQSRIAVTVTPVEGPGAFADAGDPAGDATVAAPSASATISAPATARSGAPIRVDVRSAAASLDLALLDGSGREIARRNLQAGQRSVNFTAPAVTSPTHFVLEATYSNGLASETVVRGIVVTP